MLKEEEPQKLTRVIEKIEGSKEKIDEYVSRITGVNVKVITVTRNWHRILKKVIIEEGREVLDAALGELEQELLIAEEWKRREAEREDRKKEDKTKEQNKKEEVSKKDIKTNYKKGTEEREKNVETTKPEKKEESKSSVEQFITQEVERINREIANKNKTAIKILFGEEERARPSSSQSEEVLTNHLEEGTKDKQDVEINTRKKIESSDSKTEDKNLENIEDSSGKLTQKEAMDTQEHRKNQQEHTETEHIENYKSTLEDSLWAPNEDTCRKMGDYKAKIVSVSLPGETSEERVKFVRGTLYRSKHIKKIEEKFIKGNTWVVISFDCQKGIEILKEKLKKKGNEWYKVLFEECEEYKESQEVGPNKGDKKERSTEIKGKIEKKKNKEEMEEEVDFITQTKEESQRRNRRQESKGKGRDFIWVTLWDLPIGYSKTEIQRLLKGFGSIEEIQTRNQGDSQIAEVRIYLRNKEQEERIKTNWAIGLENGKLTRLTTGNQNKDDLIERENYRAIITNVPNTAQETILLRALRFTGAKSLYIPLNSNGNPRSIAKVFFESKEDRDRAMNKSINYYNTRLYWREYFDRYSRKYEENTSFQDRKQSPTRNINRNWWRNRKEDTQTGETKREDDRLENTDKYNDNKGGGKIREEIKQKRVYEEERKTRRQHSSSSEEEQKQTQNEDIYSLFQDIKEKIEALGKRDLGLPSRS